MISIVVLLVCLYISYYTFSYARKVWKGGNKFASLNIVLLAVVLAAVSIWQLYLA